MSNAVGQSGSQVGGSNPDPSVRDRVMDAFLRLVAERGLSELSMADIARAAGVSKTTMYTRWPDRRALIADGFRQVAAVAPSTGPDTSFREAFEDIISVTVMDVASIRRRILADLIATASIDDRVQEVMHENLRAWQHAVEDLIERGKRDGEIPADRDTTVAAEIVLSLVPMRHLQAFRPVGEPLRELVWRLLTAPNPY